MPKANNLCGNCAETSGKKKSCCCARRIALTGNQDNNGVLTDQWGGHRDVGGCGLERITVDLDLCLEVEVWTIHWRNLVTGLSR